MEKCFCHLNGYKVKDADARRELEEHSVKLNEIEVNIDTIETNVDTLNTNTTTISETIDLMNEKLGNVNLLETSTKESLVDAINEVINSFGEGVSEITGDLTTLSTTDKSTLVGAINEVLTIANSNTGGSEEGSTGGLTSVIQEYNGVNLRILDSGIYRYTMSSQNVTFANGGDKSFYFNNGDIFFWEKAKFLIHMRTNTNNLEFKICVVDSSSGNTIGNIISFNANGLLTTNTAQTISATKTFNTLPQSSLTPSDERDLVTKKYVDEVASSGTIIGFAEMHTNNRQSFEVAESICVNVWDTDSEYSFSYGPLVCDHANNGIKIPAGTCEYIEVSGSVAGKGAHTARIEVVDAAGEWIEHRRTISYSNVGASAYTVNSGNSHIYKIDSSKDLWVKMAIYPNSVEGVSSFVLNEGFNNYDTSLTVKVLK